MAKRASQCISGFPPSRRLVEHIFVKSLVPRMDGALGAVCSHKSSRRGLYKLIVFSTHESIGDERMDGYGLLRRFGLARTNDTVNDRSSYVHRSLAEVDVTPLQAEQLTLSQ